MPVVRAHTMDHLFAIREVHEVPISPRHAGVVPKIWRPARRAVHHRTFLLSRRIEDCRLRGPFRGPLAAQDVGQAMVVFRSRDHNRRLGPVSRMVAPWTTDRSLGQAARSLSPEASAVFLPGINGNCAMGNFEKGLRPSSLAGGRAAETPSLSPSRWTCAFAPGKARGMMLGAPSAASWTALPRQGSDRSCQTFPRQLRGPRAGELRP